MMQNIILIILMLACFAFAFFSIDLIFDAAGRCKQKKHTRRARYRKNTSAPRKGAGIDPAGSPLSLDDLNTVYSAANLYYGL